MIFYHDYDYDDYYYCCCLTVSSVLKCASKLFLKKSFKAWREFSAFYLEMKKKMFSAIFLFLYDPLKIHFS